MVPYDVQAHPFNRAPNATPQMTVGQSRYMQGSVSDVTAASSRSSVWSVEMEHGSCGCLSGYLRVYDLLILVFGNFVLEKRMFEVRREMIPFRTVKHSITCISMVYRSKIGCVFGISIIRRELGTLLDILKFIHHTFINHLDNIQKVFLCW
jgi:hypothetical protein